MYLSIYNIYWCRYDNDDDYDDDDDNDEYKRYEESAKNDTEHNDNVNDVRQKRFFSIIIICIYLPHWWILHSNHDHKVQIL